MMTLIAFVFVIIALTIVAYRVTSDFLSALGLVGGIALGAALIAIIHEFRSK